MSDTSSSPNLLEKDDDDDDPSAEVDEEDDEDEDPSAEVDEDDDDDQDPSAMVDDDDKSSDEVEAIVQKKGRSRFWWSHTADCIVDNGNSKDEALICILLAKEPWNAGHGRGMKASQNLLAIVLETVVEGDKIFQGVSEATIKKGISCMLTLARNGRWKKRNETNQRTKKINTI